MVDTEWTKVAPGKMALDLYPEIQIHFEPGTQKYVLFVMGKRRAEYEMLMLAEATGEIVLKELIKTGVLEKRSRG